MEGLGSTSVTCDYKTRTARIASSGNKACDWKEYIDVVKLRAQSWDEFRRNRIIAYMYYNAIKMIPNTDKSLAHAQLLIDYAEFKRNHDQSEAVRLLTYGRKIMSHFAIIHVASAELELKRGNKEKAIQILHKALSLKAEPISLVTSALQQLIEGKTCSPVDCVHEDDMEQAVSPLGSEKDSSGEISSSQLSGNFSELRQALPGCRPDTQEVQHDLDMLASMPGSTSSSSERKQIQNQKHFDTPQKNSINNFSNNLRTPEPPVLLLKKYSDKTTDGFGHNVRQTLTSSNSLNYIPETPQGQRLLADGDDCSTTKKTLLHYHSTPDMRQNFGSAIIGSVSKYRPIISGPPRRVKMNPDLKKLRDEEEEEVHTQDITASAFEFLHPQSLPADKEHSADPTCCTSEQTLDESYSGTLKNISNIRDTDGTSTLSASSSNMLHMLPIPNSSAIRVSPGFPSVIQNHEHHSAFSNQPKEIERKMTEDISQRKVTPFLNAQSTVYSEPSRKLPLSTSDAMNRVTNDVPECVSQVMKTSNSSQSGPPAAAKFVDQYINVETTKEILAKQQEIIQQQQQLVQQLVQHQQLQAGGRTFSIPDQQSVIASGVMPAKPLMPPGQKIIFVNGKPYTVKTMIGRGGSAKVYKVYGPDADEALALKCVNLGCANQVIVEGYKNEINLLKKLQHCNRVIRLYDSEYIEASKKLFVVLEYGETDLCKFFLENEKKGEALHPITMHYFWFQMVLAVNAMHKEGVIHSDLKPANFILVSGKVKLIDFGIANSLQQDNTSVLKENMVGTPSYMSPEALMAINANPADSKPKYKVGIRSDVWSLGCILYQMVYNHTPFQHVKQKLEAIVNPAHEIPFPDKGDPALMDVLKKCLTRNIQQRPTTDDLLNHPYLQK